MDKTRNQIPFLKDVFICLLGAFGGPETHVSVMMDHLVIKKKYITQSELVEMMSLCHMLPGPTSTELIVSIGYKLGGPRLAWHAMLIWVLPSLVILSALSFLYQVFGQSSHVMDALLYVAPMAVGFILLAAYRMGKTVVISPTTGVLFAISLAITYFIRTPWSLPLMLVLGGLATVLLSKETNLWQKVHVKPPWLFLVTFVTIAAGSPVLASVTDHRLVQLFDSFYRFGYLVFGGGQVAVPLMYGDLVDVHQYMTGQEFMAGFGLAQGIPGPMFSFSGYAGGLAARGEGIGFQMLGAAVSGIAIFLPGLLLIFFIYPIWESIKQINGIQVALLGVNAVAGGMVAGMGIVLFQMNGLSVTNILVTLLTAALAFWGRMPVPMIVFITLLTGLLLSDFL